MLLLLSISHLFKPHLNQVHLQNMLLLLWMSQIFKTLLKQNLQHAFIVIDALKGSLHSISSSRTSSPLQNSLIDALKDSPHSISSSRTSSPPQNSLIHALKSLLLIHPLTVLAENLHKGTSQGCKKIVGSAFLKFRFFCYLWRVKVPKIAKITIFAGFWHSF